MTNNKTNNKTDNNQTTAWLEKTYGSKAVEAYKVFIDDNYSVEDFEDCYRGTFHCPGEFAEDHAISSGDLDNLPPYIIDSIDFTEMARRVSIIHGYTYIATTGDDKNTEVDYRYKGEVAVFTD